MTTDVDKVASAFYAAIQKAWNDADGAAFGAAFGDGTTFVDIRGVTHDGGPGLLAAEHQGIFDSIYKGSTIRYDLEMARSLSDDIILARGRATLDAPVGPLAGVHEAVNTIVLVRGGHEWRAVAFHNTLVTA
jgi:uncharacterized protein (TIGR02246 family)